MALAKVARLDRPRIGKQATLRRPGLRLLRGIRSAIAPVAVRPGMALAHHPLAHVCLLPADARQNPAVIVATASIDADRLVKHAQLQRLAGRLPIGLADFRRVHAVDADFDGQAARGRPHKNGVAI